VSAVCRQTGGISPEELQADLEFRIYFLGGTMNVLVVGSGGREHAICWKLTQSKKLGKLYCAPGNPGIGSVAQCVDIRVENIPALINFALENDIGLTVIGPEIPLSMGIVDEFEKAGLKVFGPSREAALLESSKSFAKEFMRRFAIPTAAYEIFYGREEALEYLKNKKFPVVIKADGLAAGKGVIIPKDLSEARIALEEIMVNRVFGSAGSKVVIEDFLEGEEASYLVFVDGSDIIPMVSAQDHKRVFDNDQGPNTGGMGAYSPAPVLNKSLENDTINNIILPVIAGMAQLGKKFKGVLYAGLMLTKDGPKVVEFNCRFGDPETQVILPRLKSDLLEILIACADGKASSVTAQWDERPAVCVVMASGGYPGKYENGKQINGLEEAGSTKDTVVFHAGTASNNGEVVSSGGRVLGVTALGANMRAAVDNAYSAVSKISFEGAQYRKDIAKRAFNR